MRTSRIVALALVVGGFFTAQNFLMTLVAGRPLSFEWSVLPEVMFWLVWAVMSPLVLAAARRWPLDARPIGRSITAQVIVSAVLAPIQTLVAFGLDVVVLITMHRVTIGDAPRWMAERSTSLVWGVFMGVMFYWVGVGLYTMLQFRRLYASEQLSAARLAGRSAVLEGELTRAQLDALRSQLRPHFLFNTLNAIATLTLEDSEKARRMLLQLGSLLRRSLDEEQHEVPLHQELLFLNEYLEIQRVRFGARLSVNLAIDPAVTQARVPVFLLQPLVENAIEHGASDQHGATSISLGATRAGDRLCLTVADAGAGLAHDSAVREGIGLRNTRARLRQLYGDQATLVLHGGGGETGGTGARVDISIPFVAEPVTPPGGPVVLPTASSAST